VLSEWPDDDYDVWCQMCTINCIYFAYYTIYRSVYKILIKPHRLPRYHKTTRHTQSTLYVLEYLKIENLKKLSRDWSLLQKVRKQGIIFW